MLCDVFIYAYAMGAQRDAECHCHMIAIRNTVLVYHSEIGLQVTKCQLCA